MARGEIIPKILEILQAGTETTVDLFDIFTSGYGESYRKMKSSIKYGPPQFKTDWAFEYRQLQQFYSLLNQLKNQGFIKKGKNNKRKSVWKVTKRGLEKLKLIKEKKNSKKFIVNYKKEKDNKLKVVAFDVPEKERYKRAWLRAVLVSLGFTLLQESVWIGKNKIPEEFIQDLRRQGMLSYVHIFEISKKGTIGQIF